MKYFRSKFKYFDKKKKNILRLYEERLRQNEQRMKVPKDSSKKHVLLNYPKSMQKPKFQKLPDLTIEIENKLYFEMSFFYLLENLESRNKPQKFNKICEFRLRVDF